MEKRERRRGERREAAAHGRRSDEHLRGVDARSERRGSTTRDAVNRDARRGDTARNEPANAKPAHVEPANVEPARDELPGGGIKGIPYIPTPHTDDPDIARWQHAGVVAFGLLMAFFTVVGLLLFARPSVSVLEKRTLTEYPAYTFQTFVDGTDLTQLALWYSDTYPLREPLVQADLGLQGLYGITPDTQMLGGNVQADELPVEGEAAPEPVSTYNPDEKVEPPTEQEMDEAIQGAITNGVYVKDGAAYNVYYFAQEAVDRYAQALNTCAENLDGQAKVYSVLVPNNSGAKLDEQTLHELGGTDQGEATKYFFSRYSDKVTGVWIWDALRQHRDEYTYFRTDHHWTQLGAYYAYVELCRAKGIDPENVPGWNEQDFAPFKGSYYADVNGDVLDPDTVQAWMPTSTNKMTFWDADGEQEGEVITDVTGWAENSLYNTFIGGDEPLARIDNPKRSDGSSCLVVKDSFGCAFVPCLVDSYQTVWVIDFRYSDKSIPQFVRENGIQDVIFLNNISMAGTNPVSQALLSQVQNDAPTASEAFSTDEGLDEE